MTRRVMNASLVLFFLPLGLTAADAINLTGRWLLNLQRSRYGNLRKPLAIVIQIDHNEPALSYAGSITSADEDTREFGYVGAIDGKQYPVGRSYGDGKIVFRRHDRYTLISVFKSDDGKYAETARTSVSADGKLLRNWLRRSPLPRDEMPVPRSYGPRGLPRG